MTRLTAYILRSITLATIIVTAGFTLAIWLTQSLRLLDLVVNAGAPASIFITLVALTMPQFLAVILPIALFAGILFVYNKLTLDSELAVMRSAGLSHWGLARPALILTVIVAVIVLALRVELAPAAKRAMESQRHEIRSEFSGMLLREGVFNAVSRGMTLYVADMGDDGTLSRLLIHDNRDASRPATIIAEEGRLIADDESSPRLVVANGSRQEYRRDTGQLNQLDFNRYTIDLDIVRETRGEHQPDTSEMGLGELRQAGDDDAMSGDKMAERLAEIHTRLSAPLYAFGFTFIAMSVLLSGSFNRRGQVNRLAIAVALVVAIQAISLGLSNFAQQSPALLPALYALPLLPTLIGIAVLNEWHFRIFRRTRRAANGAETLKDTERAPETAAP